MKKFLLLLCLVCPTVFYSSDVAPTSISGIILGKKFEGYIHTSTHQGNRPYQEDVIAMGKPIGTLKKKSSVKMAFMIGAPITSSLGIAVFDGHGGSDIAEQLGGAAQDEIATLLDGGQQPLPGLIDYLLEDPHVARGDISHDALIKKIKDQFVSYNTKLKNGLSGGGSCAVVALFLPEKIVVAHVGDSRAVSSDLVSIMTHDHKPFLPNEKKRIEKGGGVVTKASGGIYRVGNKLAVSRAFGDPGIVGVVAEPDISIFDYDLKLLATSSGNLEIEFFPISKFVNSLDLPIYTKNTTAKKIRSNAKASSGYRFVILASDGLWDDLPNRIADYFSWNFNTCDMATDVENGYEKSAIDKTLAEYQCSRLGTADIATHIVESVLVKYGLNKKSLELAIELLQLASIQKEKFKLESFITGDIVQKKSISQKIKEFFVGPQDIQSIIKKNVRKISDNQSIAIIAWDPKSKNKKLKPKLVPKQIEKKESIS
jgi:serine/threonine protein phosphatase PrpC